MTLIPVAVTALALLGCFTEFIASYLEPNFANINYDYIIGKNHVNILTSKTRFYKLPAAKLSHKIFLIHKIEIGYKIEVGRTRRHFADSLPFHLTRLVLNIPSLKGRHK